MGARTSLFLQGYADFERSHARGVYLGLSVSLDNGRSAYANATRTMNHNLVSVGATSPVDYDAGGFGWSLQADGDTTGDYLHALASGDYLGRYGEMQLTLEQFRHASLQSVDARGALVFMDGTLMASRSVSDSFAMVSTDGVEGIPVIRENRLVGTTNASGHFVVPDLHSYQANRLAIDTVGLSVDRRVDVDQMVVIPAGGAGVLAHFPVLQYSGASVILVGGDQKAAASGQPRHADGDGRHRARRLRRAGLLRAPRTAQSPARGVRRQALHRGSALRHQAGDVDDRTLHVRARGAEAMSARPDQP
jgi:outer membrane usher protein